MTASTESVAGRPVSFARVATTRAGRYGKQLTAHLGHRLTTHWNDTDNIGWIQLGEARAHLIADDDALHIRIHAPGDLDRLEDVVGRHLVRFGTKDELVVSWARDDGSPGTTQRT